MASARAAESGSRSSTNGRDPVRARFAPSPTGDLHLGGAYVAIASFLRAKAGDSAGTFVVRVEDLDPPRVIAGAEARILDDLAWLGVCADEGIREGGPFGPYRQSERGALYDAALASLDAHGLVYPCTCTRAEIARAASAPHEGDDGPRYPGTCRDPAKRRPDRPTALRLRVPEGTRSNQRFVDLVAGERSQNVAEIVGDFVLRRADGVHAYQLAVVVDDGAMAIDEVLRGDDLLASTPRQLLLAEMLQTARFQAPRAAVRYGHLPVVRGPDGARLAKRHEATTSGSTVRALRESGVSASEVRGALFDALGATRDGTVSDAELRDLAPWAPPSRWLHPRTPAHSLER